jgi:hypothetical protein
MSNGLKNWKGLFRGAFVLQTFSAHLSAIDGAAQVPNLHAKPSPHPAGALAMAAASVCTLSHGCRVFLIIFRSNGP